MRATRLFVSRTCLRAITLMTLLLANTHAQAAWQTPGTRTTEEMTTAQIAPANGLSTSMTPAYFNIRAEDISRAVAEQLQLQAIEKKADVSLAVGSPKIIYSANHPLTLAIQALQIDPKSRRWQAQANILANGRTETVKPISGTYTALVEVPVLIHQVGRNEVIEAADISTKAVPQQQVRKETITDASKLIGMSPRTVISPNRPIRAVEINSPIVVKKGDAVHVTYHDRFMNIKVTGVALQDGATGDLIRVKNDKSEKAITGRVAGAGHVEVNASNGL